MADTGWKNPGAGQNGVPSGGTDAWDNPGNILTNNGVNATATYNSAVGVAIDTQTLRSKSFGIALSAGSIINGIHARYERFRSAIVNVIAIDERLINESSVYEGNDKTDWVNWSTSVQTRTVGGSTDLWGGTWTEANVESANFGFGVRARHQFTGGIQSSVASVDYMQVRVYYTPKLGDPSVVTATNIDHNSNSLTWNDNSTGETGFRIQRSVNLGGWVTVKTTSAGVTSWTDNTASEGNQYQYRVRAEGTNPSNNVSSNFAYTPPQTPNTLAISNITSSSLRVTWNDRSSVENNYDIDVKVNGTSYVNEATLSANVELYDDSGLIEGNTYQYRVRALDTNANSAFVETGEVKLPPLDPSTISISNITSNSLRVNWVDNSSVEDNYVIEVDVNSVGFVAEATIAANSILYDDSGLSEGNSYRYRIRAKINSGEVSNWLTSSTVWLPPADPTSATITELREKEVSVSWVDNSSVENNYEISRQVDGGSWTILDAGLAANTTAYTDTTPPAAGSTVAYRIRAIDTNANSGYATTTTETVPWDFIAKSVAIINA